jgi:hypothetical protein
MLTAISRFESDPVTNPGKRGASGSQIQVFIESNYNDTPMMIKCFGTGVSSDPEIGFANANFFIIEFTVQSAVGIGDGETR